MTRSEYQELADFFMVRVERMQEETRTIVQVSVESLRDDLRAVADGVLANGRRIDENRVRIEDNGRRIDENRVRIEENGRRIDAVGSQVAALTGRVDVLEKGVSGLEKTVSGRFADHEERIGRLE